MINFLRQIFASGIEREYYHSQNLRTKSEQIERHRIDYNLIEDKMYDVFKNFPTIGKVKISSKKYKSFHNGNNGNVSIKHKYILIIFFYRKDNEVYTSYENVEVSLDFKICKFKKNLEFVINSQIAKNKL